MRAPVAAGIATRPGVRPSAVVPPAAAVAHAPTRVGVASRPGLRPSRPSAPAVAFEAWGPAPRASAISAVSAPRGVDLNLNEFDLSEAARVMSEALATPEQADAFAAMGSAFWKGLDDGSMSVFAEKERNLLKSIFNRQLSDRREDGTRFVAPDPSSHYMQELFSLVKEEEEVQQKRKDHFCSPAFSMGSAGPLFPASWTAKFEIARGQTQGARELIERPEYKIEAHVLDHVLKSATPAFDKTTEDGTKFRVYKLGSLEVRTIQDVNGPELVGVVYTVQADDKKDVHTKDSAKVAKVTEYVEKASQSNDKHVMYRRFYVVLETEQGSVIVTEKFADGTVAWKENPTNLEDRNSLAKVTRTADYRGANITIRDLKTYMGERKSESSASYSECKHYAQGIFSRCLQLSVDSPTMQQEGSEARSYSGEDSTADSSEEVEEYSDKKQSKFQQALYFNRRQKATDF